jgi:hypothetical protein
MMATNAAEALDVSRATGALARLADRWIYVFMAALFVLTALGGFVPTSLAKIQAVRAGQRPPFLPVLHVHAVVMGSWLLLLLAQTTLVARGRRRLHAKLGLVALAWAPAMLVVMTLLVTSSWHQVAALPSGLVPPPVLREIKTQVSNILLEQIRAAVLFAVFIGWAIMVRRRDSQAHKRLMILGTLMPLSAGIDRLVGTLGLPTNFPLNGYEAEYGYLLLWLAPALLYDLFRLGHVHRAYVLGLACLVPFAVATHFLWNSSWWLVTAPKLMGVPGW